MPGRSLRVLILGNTNNEPFRLGTELARLGCSVTLVPTSRGRLHDPRDLQALPYFDDKRVEVLHRFRFAPQLSWMVPRGVLRKGVLRLARDHDFAVLNGVAHSFGPALGIPWASMVTGADVIDYASLEWSSRPISRWARVESKVTGADARTIRQEFRYRQALGLRHARFLIGAPRGASPDMDRVLRHVGAADLPRLRFISRPSAAAMGLRAPAPRGLSPGTYTVLAPRLSTRSVDTRIADMDDKGSEIALQGWNLAVRSGYSGRLAVFRKGAHVKEIVGRCLSDDAGESVTWLDPMPYPDYVSLIANSRVVIESVGSSPVGRGAIEALSNGVPCISSSSSSVLEDRLGVRSRLHFTCGTPDEVAEALLHVGSIPSDLLQWVADATGWSQSNSDAELILDRMRD